MTGFSATDAALEGFRITRERPKALAAWTAFSFAVSLAGVLITVNMPADARRALEALKSEQTPDPNALLQALATLSPLLLFGLAVQCMMAAAVYRIMLRPADQKYSYLRLGRDELRLMALTLIYLALGVVLIAAIQLVVFVVAMVASALGQGAMVFVGSVTELFTIGVFVYVAVRMSLAPVITFEHGKLSIFDSWALTRGQFWRLLGAYLLAICCVFVVAVLAMILFWSVSALVVLATGGSLTDLRAIQQPDETRLATYANPFMIAYMIVGSLFTAIYYAVIAAPGAYAYRALGLQPPTPTVAGHPWES